MIVRVPERKLTGVLISVHSSLNTDDGHLKKNMDRVNYSARIFRGDAWTGRNTKTWELLTNDSWASRNCVQRKKKIQTISDGWALCVSLVRHCESSSILINDKTFFLHNRVLHGRAVCRQMSNVTSWPTCIPHFWSVVKNRQSTQSHRTRR